MTLAAGAAGRRTVPMRLDAVLLFALGLVANALAAQFITQPGYTDAYYYFGGARQLASGHGFVEPYLWNYLTPLPGVDPRAWLWSSHLYWMPLVSIVAAPFILAAQALLGSAISMAALFRAAQLPFILLASSVPLLSYVVARQVGGGRRQALVAGLLTLFSPFYFVFWTTSDAFALYALTAAGAILLTVRAEAPAAYPGRWLFAAGLAAGLAHLTRADGSLLLACLVVWVGARRSVANGRRGRLTAEAALVAGYLVVMGPWYWRNWIVVGAPLAPGVLRTIWLTNYDDLFRFSPDRLSAAAYLGSGAARLLGAKWSALVANTETLIAVQCSIVAFPFVVVGLWHLRKNPVIRLAVFYAGVLLAALTLVFTFPGARGGYFHSGAALLPFFMPAAIAGLESSVDTAARFLHHWQPERSKPIFTGLLLVFAVGLTGVVFWMRALGPDPRRPAWAQSEAVYAEVGAWLQAHGQGPLLVAVNDPPGWYYWTGGPAIVIPNDDVTVLRQAMNAFGARWLLLDANRPLPLSGVYAAPVGLADFQLRARFSGADGQPAYLFELAPRP